MSVNRPTSGYIDSSQQTTYIAEVVNNKDDVAKNRFQCRMIGHESDTISIPDSDLVWHTPITPDGVGGGTGYNPRYLPGDKVICMKMGEDRFIIGAYRADSPEIPKEKRQTNPSAEDGTASNKHRLPASTDQHFGWKGKIPTEAIQSVSDVGGDRTHYARNNVEHQRNKSKISQGQNESKNQFGRTSSKSKAGVEKSIGRQNKFDNGRNAMQFIKNRINNNGSVIPSLLDAVENLRSIAPGTNPDAIVAVGASTFAGLFQQLLQYVKDMAQDQNNTESDEQTERRQKQAEQAQEDQKNANDGDTR